jgi:hypothetical protein
MGVVNGGSEHAGGQDAGKPRGVRICAKEKERKSKEPCGEKSGKCADHGLRYPKIS